MKTGRMYRKQALYPLGVEASTTNIAATRTMHIDRTNRSPMADLLTVMDVYPRLVLYLPVGQNKDTKGWFIGREPTISLPIGRE
jgi:hypothetical protein